MMKQRLPAPGGFCRILFFLLLLTACFPDKAIAVSRDSVVHYRPEKFHRYVVNIDNRNSFAGGKAISIIGLKAGISIHHRVRLGLGYHQLLSPVRINYTIQNQNDYEKITFWYVSAYAEYVIIHRKRFEVSAPLAYGLGGAPVVTHNSLLAGSAGANNLLQLAEISLNGYYKIFNWIGPGAGFGYRFMLGSNSQVSKVFDAPVYVFRIQIFLDPLYHDLFPSGLRKKDD